jgi:hypothetical protein
VLEARRARGRDHARVRQIDEKDPFVEKRYVAGVEATLCQSSLRAPEERVQVVARIEDLRVRNNHRWIVGQLPYKRLGASAHDAEASCEVTDAQARDSLERPLRRLPRECHAPVLNVFPVGVVEREPSTWFATDSGSWPRSAADKTASASA